MMLFLAPAIDWLQNLEGGDVMKDWNVQVVRVGYRQATLTVRANTAEEAEAVASAQAANHEFSGEYAAEYETNGAVPAGAG